VTGPGRKVVLDASAALEWVLARSCKDVIDKLLPVGVLPSSALSETLYVARLEGHRQSPDELRSSLATMGVAFEAVLEDDAVRAAVLIAESRAAKSSAGVLSLGDGLCIAVAERLRLPVTSSDQYWETLDLSVKVLPFR
jgi:PIN domain nuclease of toxin-antitoxin system